MADHQVLPRCQDRGRTPDRCVTDQRYQSGPVRTGPCSNRCEPVCAGRDDELVEVLKQQLTHERDARKAMEEKNRELISMYHEISMASTRFGIEIGKGMQEQGKARQIGADGKTRSNRPHGAPPVFREMPGETSKPRLNLQPKARQTSIRMGITRSRKKRIVRYNRVHGKFRLSKPVGTISRVRHFSSSPGFTIVHHP